MRLRLNLQWKVLLQVAGTMIMIVMVSAYLHQLITKTLIEEYRYNNAVAQVVTVAKRAETKGYFGKPDDLLQDMQFLINSRPDFNQIDVFQLTPGGNKLVATTAPGAPRLPYLNEKTKDNELGEMERPLPDVVSVEIERDGRRYWVITAAINEHEGNGYVTALVQKTSRTDFVSRLQFQHNVVLGGGAIVSIALLYWLFAFMFRRPAQEIVAAMGRARTGDLSARARVLRDDELGTIASGFNMMMDDLCARDQEREQLLLQVRNFNDQLQSEVAQATSELRASNDALFETQQGLARSERLAAVGQIAASLAHEIGTPLNAISGHLRLLARNYPHDTNTQRRVAIINSQMDSVVKSVKSLLARTQRPQPALQRLDLNELVEELIWLVQPTLEAHEIAVVTHLDHYLPLMWGNHDGLLQLFLNLVNNSIDAMPEGGTIEITTRFDRLGRIAELLFYDSGLGIDPSAMDHLFEPMWTTKEGGSGFGLAIAREIAIDHGGKIEVIAAEHQGATFRLRLPLSVKAALNQEVVTGVA